MISIGIVRKVLDTFTGTEKSWDEAVGGGDYNTLAAGDFYEGGNASEISGNNWV